MCHEEDEVICLCLGACRRASQGDACSMSQPMILLSRSSEDPPGPATALLRGMHRWSGRGSGQLGRESSAANETRRRLPAGVHETGKRSFLLGTDEIWSLKQ